MLTLKQQCVESSYKQVGESSVVIVHKITCYNLQFITKRALFGHAGSFSRMIRARKTSALLTPLQTQQSPSTATVIRINATEVLL